MTAATRAWLADRGIVPFAFQRAVWRALRAGESGLLHASTGSGKTLAAWLGALDRLIAGARRADARRAGAALRIVWLTPMRALAADTHRALAEPLAHPAVAEALGARGLQPEVALRTGDTGSAERARQERRPPLALVTTPESLTLLCARADAPQRLGRVEVVIVDEWHELMGNKRGVQVQLALARLRRLNPALAVWGLSATLGNVEEALAVLLGPGRDGRLVKARAARRIVVDTLLPPQAGRFPWGGHLGLAMLEPVIAELEASASTLVFTNTRSQAESWYRHLLDARPDWAGLIALHHGSLDREVRDWVERALKEGRLKAVVCTSSLDLGVDFSPVERVLQIGSAKGVARLLQRAGRSGHAPGLASRVTLVPTNALEIIEGAAAADAIAAHRIEARTAPRAPMDVLVQHLVTVALGGGFTRDAMLAELRTTHAYQALDDAAFDWALDFVGRGGPSLQAYPEYRRVVVDADGCHRVPDHAIARRHRQSIGTIVADSAIRVAWQTGGNLGTVEEGFIGRLRRGDVFLFAGRMLELVRIHEMTAYVKRASRARGAIPRWGGGRMPLSSELADAVLARLAQAEAGRFEGAAMKRVQPLLELQRRWSALPSASRLLVEALASRDGHHLFVYPFAGRHVHVGLASLFAWRLARERPATVSIAVNDYGFELLSPDAIDVSSLCDGSLLSGASLVDDMVRSLNAGELARRRFREIARISGLVFQGGPGAARSARQLQASASLFYEVLRKHDADNRLLGQAEAEVLAQELELERIEAALAQLRGRPVAYLPIERPTPFAFALMVERLRERVSTEKLADRIARMVAELERAASPAGAPGAVGGSRRTRAAAR
ncbi:MAG: ligase-associated DNA damage response DEXH box helicase [Lautropia sp.]